VTTKILQIIPTPPHRSDGIGDYALLLAEQLLKEHQVMTHFLVFRNDIKVESRVDGFPIARLTAHSAQTFIASIPDHISGIILHFSAYPYFKTNRCGTLGLGTPFWLVDALQTIIQARSLKLVVMFHELPKLHWQELHFNILNPIQSIVSRQLAKLADTVITNTSRYQALLSSWVEKPVLKLPIFSNMGEPAAIPALTERKPRMVVFGGTARRRVYQSALQELLQACRTLEVEEINDVGPALNLQKNYHFSGINVVELGFLEKKEISQLMSTSIGGCFDYANFPGDLSKSSVLAAYCAHGLIPILTQYNPSEADGLEINQHYLALDRWQPQLNREELQAIANNARQWYQTHTIQTVVEVFASNLLEKPKVDFSLFQNAS
jgi:hypothetical protein